MNHLVGFAVSTCQRHHGAGSVALEVDGRNKSGSCRCRLSRLSSHSDHDLDAVGLMSSAHAS